MKNRIDEELDKLDLGIMSLSATIEEALVIITSSLVDQKGKERIEELYGEMEEKSKSLEAYCTNLLLRFHPVAKDLKRISSSLSTVRDLFRIGDNALDFFEMLEFLSSRDLFEEIGLKKMAEEVKKMYSSAISCFMARDVEKAKKTEAYDDVIDTCFSEIREKLCQIIRSGREGAEEGADLVIGAKYLERMGDHASAIAHSVLVQCSVIDEE